MITIVKSNECGDVYPNNCVHVCQVIGRIKRGYLKSEPETSNAVYGASLGHHHNVFVSSGETPGGIISGQVTKYVDRGVRLRPQ